MIGACGSSGWWEEEVEVDWGRLLELPQTAITRDFHCVTQWSKLDVDWAGVRLADALALWPPDTRGDARDGLRIRRLHHQPRFAGADGG